MPIVPKTNSSAPVVYPKADYPVVKYMDLIRFISLLSKQALFFCRIDKLEDKFEGTTAKLNYNTRINWYKQVASFRPVGERMTDADIKANVEVQYNFEKKFRALNCVCCWNKKDLNESAALWKIYSDFSKGIMIKSSISRFKNAFMISNEEVNLSEVIYIDRNNAVMAEGNTIYPFIHKHNSYSYENEVRLLYEIKPKDGWEHDWSQEEVEEGIYIKVDLNELIDEIVIGPYSPKWFTSLIKDISNKYGLNKPINYSELSI